MDALSKELALFWRKLSRLLGSGVPIVPALDAIRQETNAPALQDAIGRMRQSVDGGRMLSEALADAPALFSLSARMIVKAAEAAGRLDKVCLTIAEGVEDGTLRAASGETAPSTGPGTDKGPEANGDGPVVQRSLEIIHEAIKVRASDIHLESTPGDLRVRYRIDGALRDMDAVPASLAAAVVNRFQSMAALNLAERRLPQDGRILLDVEGRQVDLRISSIPCLDGENIVIRVLTAPTELPKLERIGFTVPGLTQVRSWIARPHGLILVTGPTGSGKTTTLYSMVQELNTPALKVVMAEEPVELRLPGASQMSIRPACGLTFPAALRAMLRQDPDVIFTTEIRDRETAAILVESALTGHLVMSTLHTQDAAEALQRLIDIGVEPFLIDSALVGVIAQRLVRTVCPKCKEEYRPEPWALESVSLPAGARFFRGKGCEHCAGTGYRGRQAVHELLEMNDELRKAVKDEAGAARFREIAVKAGMKTLRETTLAKVLDGVTTLEEALTVCGR